MEDSFGGMFKLIDSNYSVWKLKMRDMLVVNDLWLPVWFGDKRAYKIDVSTLEVMHMMMCIHKMLHRHELVQQLQ